MQQHYQNNTVLNTVFSKKNWQFQSKKKERTLIFFFFSRCPGEKRKSCIKWKNNTQDPIKFMYFLHVLPFSPWDSQFKLMSESTGHSVVILGRFVNLFGDFSPLCAVAPILTQPLINISGFPPFYTLYLL